MLTDLKKNHALTFNVLQSIYIFESTIIFIYENMHIALLF